MNVLIIWINQQNIMSEKKKKIGKELVFGCRFDYCKKKQKDSIKKNYY